MDWINTNLKRFIEVQSGAAFKSEEFVENGVPVVKIANINNNTLIKTKSDSFIKESDLEKYKDVILKYGDILIAMSGNTTCKMGRVSTEFTPSLLNQRVGWIKPISEEIDINFVYQLLISETYQKRLWTFATATGQPNLSPRDIKRISFVKPPKPEQTAIATILSKVDQAIESTRQSIKAAEKLKKALMQNLLTGKLKPDGTWRTDDEFYEDEKFGKVPVGWEVKNVNEIVERKNDTIDPVKSKEIFDYVGLEHIAQGEFIRIGKGKSNETLAIKVTFDKGDLLYGKLRPYLNKVWLADISGVGSTEFLVFEKDKFIDWVYLNFQTKRFLNFTLSMTAGTQHPRASWRDIKRFLIAKPINIDELNAISTKILATEKDKKSKQTKIKTLQRLKKTLMQNLLTGKVRVDVEAINKIISEQNNG